MSNTIFTLESDQAGSEGDQAGSEGGKEGLSTGIIIAFAIPSSIVIILLAVIICIVRWYFSQHFFLSTT